MSDKTTNKRREAHAKRVATDCYNSARSMLGSGWLHVSVDVRRALVMERVLGILLGQDESIDPRSAIELTRLIAQDADAMVRGE